jgi:hypothetical protein
MADKLGVYNGALRLCNERKLASLSDSSERRRALDAAWNNGEAIRFCLESGQWTFATRTGMIDYTPSVEPSFGYRRAFTQPTDFVRLVAMCSDEYFKVPLLEYADERQYWYADLDTLYVKWVSNDTTYGGDLSLWSAKFAKFVEAYLAYEIAPTLTGMDEKTLKVVIHTYDQRKKDARSLDAMNKPTQFTPPGSWVSARGGGVRSPVGDGGWSV